MDNKNLHLRNKLRNEELPPEFAWDKVSPGILVKVIDRPTTGSNYAINALYLLTAMIFIGGLALLLFVPNTIQDIQQNNRIASTKKQEETVTIAANSESERRAKKTTNIKTSAPNSMDIVKSDSDNSAFEIEPKKNIALINGAKPSNSRTKQTASAELTKEDNHISTKQQLYQAASRADNSITQNGVAETSATTKNIADQRVQTSGSSPMLEGLTPLPFAYSHLASLAIQHSPIEDQRALPTITASTNSTKIELTQKQSRLAMELGVGTNFLQHNYNGSDLADVQQKSTNAVLGQSLSIGLRYELGTKWSVSSGLHYQSLATKLDYYNSWETMTPTAKRIIEVNSLTGQPTDEYFTETTVRALAYDSVIHYNAIKVLSIPVVVNRSWGNYKGLSLETRLGLSYGIVTSSHGKQIRETASSEFKDYEVVQYSDKQYTSKANALAGINLRYPLGNRCYLMGSLTGSYALSSWAYADTYSNKPVIWDAGLKFGFKL